MVFGRGFTFILGSLCGVYVAQHYRVPRIGDWIHSSCVKAHELEQAYRRPENFNFNERSPARDCWFRVRCHGPENFYSNEAGKDKNNEVVHPSLSRPINHDGPKALDHNEAREEQYNNKVIRQGWARPIDLDGTYCRPENFDPNEVHEKQNKNNVIHPSWARPRDLNKPYNNNGPEYFDPNEAGQE